MRQRLLWIDALRGFLILTVILGHALQHGDYNHNIAWNVIYSFHMAAFFVISGYANYWSAMNAKTLLRRAEQLLIPFLAWTVLVAFRSGDFLNTLADEIFHPKMYWFIFALFFISALFISIKQLAGRLRISDFFCMIGGWLILVGLMLVANIRYFGFQYIAYYFVFYVLGYYINHCKWTPQPGLIIAFGAGWLVLAPFWRMTEVSPLLSGLTFVPSPMLIFTYRFVAAALGALFLMFTAPMMFANSNRLSKMFAYLGRESLGIYIIHIFIATYWTSYLARQLGTDTSGLFIFLDFLVKLVVSILGVELIKRIPYIRYLLLGIKQSK